MKRENPGNKTIADNRYARYEYSIFDTFEAGIVLTGTEVKAARGGKVQLKDGWAEIRGGEAWLENVHISEYSHGNIENHKPVHARKLQLVEDFAFQHFHREQWNQSHHRTDARG